MVDKLVLVDGNSLVHRAFHALPPLTSPSGEMTNATYGFTMMLLKAIEDIKPSHVAAAFDTPKPTFRHQRYEGYKATRPPTPDGLAQQFARVDEILDALSVPVFRLDGVEADDILGSLAEQAAALGMDVVIITGDTDAFQLVGPRVSVLAPRRGLTDTVIYDENAVQERYGLEPRQLVDLRALRGDTSDNIPGVPGIGDKTAAKLLQTYGTVEGVIEHLFELPSRQQAQLAPYTEQMRMSRQLAEIVREVPVQLDVAACARRPVERERLLALFHELGFRSLIERLPTAMGGASAPGATRQPSLFDSGSDAGASSGGASSAAPDDTPVEIPPSSEELAEALRMLREAGGLVGTVLVLSRPEAMRADIVGMALGSANGGWVYAPLEGAEEDGLRPLAAAEVLETLRPLLEDAEIRKASANAKQEIVALARAGVSARGFEFDAPLAAYLVDASQRSLTLQDLSWSRLNRELQPIKAVTGEGRSAIPIAEVGVRRMAAHAGREARTLVEIEPSLRQELEHGGFGELYRDVELPLVSVLADMELAGIAVDVPYLAELSRELHDRIADAEASIFGAVGHDFNINSSQQLATVLFDELKLPGAKKTSTGRASTAADVLSTLRGTHDVIDLILEHRELTKLKSTYVDALPLLVHPETGRIHTTFNQTVAATGRLSSADPNVQNIPVRTELGRRVRRAFVAPGAGWKLLSADYSQIELRIEAHLTQDPTMMEAFQAGEDIHAATASELFGVPIEEVTADQRRLAKTANFAIIYGVSAFGFAEQTGLSQHESADFIRRYFDRFSEVSAFQRRLLAEARLSGAVYTLLGRKRMIPELKATNYAVRSAGERMAINAPVQGTASDIIKIAMVRVHRYLAEHQLRTRMLLQVHDELMFEVPDDELDQVRAAAKEIMEGAMSLTVPVVVDLRAAENWGAMY